MILISDTTNTEATTEAPTAETTEDKVLETAKRLRDMWVASAKARVDQHTTNGDIMSEDQRDLYVLLGLPVAPGESNVEVTAQYKSSVTYRVPGSVASDRESIVSWLKGKLGVPRDAHAQAHSMGSEIELDEHSITGLPEDEDETTEEAPVVETADDVLASIDTMKAALHKWCRDNVHRWCGARAANTSLKALGIDPLPRRRGFTVTRPLANGAGHASYYLNAFSPEEAIEEAKKMNWEHHAGFHLNDKSLTDEYSAEEGAIQERY